MTELLNVDKWTTNLLDLKSNYFPSKYSIKYDKTLEKSDIEFKNDKQEFIQNMRKSAECHRHVRKFIQPLLKPGMKYIDICDMLENKIVDLMGENTLNQGVGFYTSWSVNEVIAHDSAIPDDKRVLEYNDVCKLDFGTHVNGFITDSAFTVAFNPKYKPLLDATKEATWAGIKLAGPDTLVNEIAKSTKEIIDSYEIDLNEDGNMIPIRPVLNLGGHNINQYQIHGGDLILCVPSIYTRNIRMKPNSIYAIETFATTGKGYAYEDNDFHCSHYMRNEVKYDKLNFNVSKKLLNFIDKNRGTLPFCTRYLDDNFEGNYNIALKELKEKNLLKSYPRLQDKKGSFSSQLEHTIYLHDQGKEVLSYGEDY